MAEHRRRATAALDRVVADNRVTLAVVVPVVGAALMVAAGAGVVPRWLVFAPALLVPATVAMRLPLVAALLPTVDRRAVAGLVALVALTYGVELLGVATGWPYGEFTYGVRLGPMVGGLVPLALPLFFLPLVFDAYLLALHLLGPRADSVARRVPLALALVLAVDLVLDPAAVAIGFWSYAAGGPYYAVPLSNFAGWLFTGTLALVLVELSFDWTALRDRLDTCRFALDDVVSFTVLWGLVNAAASNAVPALLAAGLLAVLAGTGRLDAVPFADGRPAEKN